MKQLNLQDVFLNQARREKITVTIYLTNGFQFKGVVKGLEWVYDKFCGRLTEVFFRLLGRLDGKDGLSCSKLVLCEGLLTLILVVCAVAFRA